MRIIGLGLLAAVVAGGLPTAAAQERAAPRLALVIGEGAYPEGRLPTAVEDAGLLASGLAQAGFTVTAVADADAATLRKTIADFAAKARGAGPGVALAVYVSGVGLQYDGENWLVPVGARIERADDVPRAALKLAEITAPLQGAAASLRLFMFDLARENPFAAKGGLLAGGLALAEAPAGSVYAYNAAPGAIAPAAVPPFGAYARALAEAIQTPGLPVEVLLRRVRLRVGERTDGAVVPFDDGAADPGFAFFPGAAVAPAPLPDMAGLPVEQAYSVSVARDTLPAYAAFVAAYPHEPLTGRIRAMMAVRREALIWSEAVRANTPRAYWTYLRRYPRGPHYGDVRRMLFALHAGLEPPPRFDIVTFEGLPPPPPEELPMLERTALTFADADGPSIPPVQATLMPPARAAYYEAMPPAPIAPAGALPLPLPLPVPGQAPVPGLVQEPDVPGGALVTSLVGSALATVRPGQSPSGQLVSRVSDAVKDRQRTILQTDAAGRVISKTSVASGADGALSVVETGPGERPLFRAVSRDTNGGLREIGLVGPDGRTFATVVVTADGIVKSAAFVPGQGLPPRFVLAPGPDPKDPKADPKSGPTIVPEVLGRPPEPGAGADVAAAEPLVAATRPPLPPTPGLTGEAPKLDLPPAPKGAVFDSAAAPVAAEAPAPAGAPAPAAPAVSAPGAAPVPAAVPAAAPPAPEADSASSDSAKLPDEPPLPPRRAVPKAPTKPEPKTRHRGRR